MAIFAQDDQGNPNDPTVNDRANACYEGGSMAGKCDTSWEWEGGWYLIRFQYGLILREDFPRQFALLLPAEADATEAPAETDIAVGSSCFGPIYGTLYADFQGGNFLAGPVQLYADSTCMTPYITLFLDLIYTTGDTTAATTLCNANLPGTVAAPLGNNIYYCT